MSVEGNCKIQFYAEAIVTCIMEKNFLSCPSTMTVQQNQLEEAQKYLEKEDSCGYKYNDVFQISPAF